MEKQVERQVKRREKKTYEKPQIVHRQMLEAMAGVCQQSDPINGKAGAGCTVINSYGDVSGAAPCHLSLRDMHPQGAADPCRSLSIRRATLIVP